MKFFKVFALTMLFAALIGQVSTANHLDDPNSELKTCVIKLLMKPKFDTAVDEEVRISFFVTADEELVVLKTDARTKMLDKFIKTRMNYKKIDIQNLEVNRIFNLKVHFFVDKDSYR